jgi:hypothetical protein
VRSALRPDDRGVTKGEADEANDIMTAPDHYRAQPRGETQGRLSGDEIFHRFRGKMCICGIATRDLLGDVNPKASTMTAIILALERAGIEFIREGEGGKGEGARLSRADS